MHVAHIIWLIGMFLLLWQGTDAQDAWEKIPLHGKIVYHSVTTTKQFDPEGEIIGWTEAELEGETDQILTFFPGRFQLMAKSHEKLTEFNEANTQHIFYGEVTDPETSERISFPVKFSTDFKAWGKCDQTGGLILMQTSKGSGTSGIIATQSFLSMIEIRSPDDVDNDKTIAKGVSDFARQVMEMKKAQDIKDGKTINEADYFVPEALRNEETYGLFLFTNWWSADFQNLPVEMTQRSYDCTAETWETYPGSTVDLRVSSGNKLMDDYQGEDSAERYRYVSIPNDQMEAFIKDPTVPTTFTGGSYTFKKDQYGEEETRTIIKLTVSRR